MEFPAQHNCRLECKQAPECFVMLLVGLECVFDIDILVKPSFIQTLCHWSHQWTGNETLVQYSVENNFAHLYSML